MELNTYIEPTGDEKATRGLERLLRHFRKDEDGSIIIFSIFMFVLVLWFGGMSVDLMRFETTRAKLQGTLDRATLAAADLDQVLSPADVVRDYFSKAGMLEFLDGEPIVDQGINYRVVTANGKAVMPLFFYDLPKVFSSPFTAELTTLTVSGASTAEERVTDVEVSLVLDVSGSMKRDNRIQNLRPAARDFVSTVLANNTNAPQGLITISIVPYSAVVNPGTDIVPHLNVNRAHNYSTCLLFDDDEFLTTELDLNASYDHVAHFDPDWESNADQFQPIEYPWCHTDDHNAIVPHTTNEAALHTHINDLTPYGNTAIDMGMKWGVALLDPSTNAIISALAGQPDTGVPMIASTRPEAHTQSDVLKVIVLMTDGSNTQQYDLYDGFKFELSPVWFNRESATQSIIDVPYNRTSVQYDGADTTSRWDDYFYWNGYPSTSYIQRYPNGFADRNEYINATPNGPFGGPGTGDHYANDTFNAHWQDLYAIRTYNEINRDYFWDAYNNTSMTYSEYRAADYGIDYNVVNSSRADDRLSDICEVARNEGIIIYTVAFEAHIGGRAALRDCASSASHYFDVQGTDISAAFSAIASDIRALKLTQ